MTIYRDACRSTACRRPHRVSSTVADGVLVVTAIVLGLIRCLGVRHQAFQAAAHLYVGGMLGYAAAEWRRGGGRLELSLAVGLSLLEVVCFLLGVGR
jgi:hypothetical protein